MHLYVLFHASTNPFIENVDSMMQMLLGQVRISDGHTSIFMTEELLDCTLVGT